MRIAIISDVHADVHALRDALTQAERLRCDAIVCAGDLIDYGLFPSDVISLLRERRIPTIRGNHDRWALGRGRADEPHAVAEAQPHDASGWDLSPDALRFLAELPTAWNLVVDGVRVAVRHGTPRSDMDGIYPDNATAEDARRWLNEAEADVLLVGHTHIAFAMTTLDGGIIANPGALLRESADADVRPMVFDRETGKFVPGPARGGGTFGVLELPARRFTVHRAADGVEVEIPRPTIGVRDRRSGG